MLVCLLLSLDMAMATVSMLWLTIPMVGIALSTEPPRASLGMASVRLNLGMEDMVGIAMFTEQLRDLLVVMEAITRDLLLLVMDTPQELATTTGVPREFKDTVMEAITRDLQLLDTTMAMGIPMSTRTVLPTMDPMDMRLSMTTGRDLLRLDMALQAKATSMSADLTLSIMLRFTTQRPTMATIKF